MLIGTLPLILIMSKMKAMEALTVRKTEHVAPLTEDKVILKSEERERIKNYLESMNKNIDDKTLIRDPSSYCRSFDNCYECVKSLWFPCGWCHNFGCTENPEKICPIAESKAEVSNVTGEIISCPYAEHEGPIIVAAGIKTQIQVKLYIPDPAIYEKEIICQIKVAGRVTHLKGVLLDNVVLCYYVVLQSHAERYGDMDRGSLTIMWGGAHPYSNDIPLIVYNCERMASHCEACRKIPASFGCGWCDSKVKCVIKEKCPNNNMQWSQNRLSCQNNGKKYITD